MATPRLQPVYVSINRPLTIGGADRRLLGAPGLAGRGGEPVPPSHQRLFFVALVVGGATFTLFGSLFGGLLMFVVLSAAARWVTQRDPQLLRIVLRSATARARYDPGKVSYVAVTQEGRR